MEAPGQLPILPIPKSGPATHAHTHCLSLSLALSFLHSHSHVRLPFMLSLPVSLSLFHLLPLHPFLYLSLPLSLSLSLPPSRLLSLCRCMLGLYYTSGPGFQFKYISSTIIELNSTYSFTHHPLYFYLRYGSVREKGVKRQQLCSGLAQKQR